MNKVNIKGRKKLTNAQMLKILKLYRESKKNANYNNIITTNPTLSNNKEDLNTNMINSNIIATEINSGENEDIKNDRKS